MKEETISDLCYLDEPELDRPALIMGFSGWPNAGDVSTGTLTFLLHRLKSRPLAFMKTDAFYDFASHRPSGSIHHGLVSAISMPKNEFFYVKGEKNDQDLILFLGQEPDLRWEAFSDLILGLAQDFGVGSIYTLGGTYDYLPHWLEPRVSVVFSSEEFKSTFGLIEEFDNVALVEYDGPISIHSMLSFKARSKGIPVFGLWGHAPVYIHTGNLKVHLRLVEILTRIIGFTVNTSDLVEGLEQMDHKIQVLMQENPQLKKFIQELEEEHGKQDDPSSRRSLLDSSASRGKVISIDEFLKRERENSE
ncbi:MAG: PAC2 family protein [Deltaproteobacteria bacterium]|nr:PAC2 family protein [Deltaproteobacteria bacterium]MBW2087196.1 PAC2 family protein [Deltaproteobacteria bacterium]